MNVLDIPFPLVLIVIALSSMMVGYFGRARQESRRRRLEADKRMAEVDERIKRIDRLQENNDQIQAGLKTLDGLIKEGKIWVTSSTPESSSTSSDTQPSSTPTQPPTRSGEGPAGRL